MRSTLITAAAWLAAIAIVLWQRLLWPGLQAFFPGLGSALEPGWQLPEPASSGSAISRSPRRSAKPARRRTAPTCAA